MIGFLTAISLALFFAGSVLAQEGVVQTVTEGCSKEINVYCKNVTPGEGRLLDCLERNRKKVGKRCTQAIRDVGLK